MLGNGAFNERDGLSEYGDIALEDAFHIVGSAETAACETLSVQVRIDDGDRSYAAVHCQACIFGIVLRMEHLELIVKR